MKGALSYVDQRTKNLRWELNETIERTQVELQIVELSLDTLVQVFEEKNNIH
jgi:hypothetical protein